MLLTREDREKFIKYLELEIHSDDGIIEQMEKLPHLELLIKKIKSERLAAQVILHKLQSTEDVSIG